MVKESTNRFDLTGEYKDKHREELVTAIREDKERTKRQADYVDVLRADFRKNYPERAWYLPEDEDVKLAWLNVVFTHEA